MRDGEPTIRQAVSRADYAAFGEVCRDYVQWCRQRYADMPWFVEAVFGHQSFGGELEMLAAKYGPPDGRTLIAELDGEVVAGVACHRFADGVCELKRLYVGEDARGHGLGRRLTEAMMALARDDGYSTMVLDTADRLTEAISLYRTTGFEPVPAYQAYPEALLPHLVFMERRL